MQKYQGENVQNTTKMIYTWLIYTLLTEMIPSYARLFSQSGEAASVRSTGSSARQLGAAASGDFSASAKGKITRVSTNLNWAPANILLCSWS